MPDRQHGVLWGPLGAGGDMRRCACRCEVGPPCGSVYGRAMPLLDREIACGHVYAEWREPRCRGRCDRATATPPSRRVLSPRQCRGPGRRAHCPGPAAGARDVTAVRLVPLRLDRTPVRARNAIRKPINAHVNAGSHVERMQLNT